VTASIACLLLAASLPPWTPGTLDIHQIDTGRGNAALVVLPDGTAILIDAGEVPDRPGLELGPRLPNASRPTGAWIAEYVRQFAPRPELDHAVLTHHHDDHISAIADVAASIPIRRLIDRGLDPPAPPFPAIQKYLAWRRERTVETIRVGSASQIVAGGVDIRVVAGNGSVWTGLGDRTVSRFPDGWPKLPAGMLPNENQFSIALRIRYGAFDYFTGGDLVGTLLDGVPDWHDLETPVAQAIGAVDVAVLNHHGWLDSTNAFFLRTLNPRVVIVPAWHASHPDHGVLRRLRSPEWKPAPPDLFITRLLDAPKAIMGYLREPFKSTQGHVVVRAERGGQQYRVFVLNSAEERPSVREVFGPYPSR
jgi:beta-lactamase superfamily II metal-dependent hydrolase